MNRKEFLKKSILGLIGLSFVPFISHEINNLNDVNSDSISIINKLLIIDARFIISSRNLVKALSYVN